MPKEKYSVSFHYGTESFEGIFKKVISQKVAGFLASEEFKGLVCSSVNTTAETFIRSNDLAKGDSSE